MHRHLAIATKERWPLYRLRYVHRYGPGWFAAQGKTVIPVAKIIYGYGGGAGTGGVGNSGARGEGGGGGGGAMAIPVGVVEVTDQQTRFVPIIDRRKLAGAVVMGIGLGMWLGWRRRR